MKKLFVFLTIFLFACSGAVREQRDDFLNQDDNPPTKHPKIQESLKEVAIRYSVKPTKYLSSEEILFFWSRVAVTLGVKAENFVRSLEILRINTNSPYTQCNLHRSVGVLDGLLTLMFERMSSGKTQRNTYRLNICLDDGDGLESFYGATPLEFRKAVNKVAKESFGYNKPPLSIEPEK